jgi:hypothetical protein
MIEHPLQQSRARPGAADDKEVGVPVQKRLHHVFNTFGIRSSILVIITIIVVIIVVVVVVVILQLTVTVSTVVNLSGRAGVSEGNTLAGGGWSGSGWLGLSVNGAGWLIAVRAGRARR